MKITNQVVVMNEYTYQQFRIRALERAEKEEDPIAYLAKWGDIKIRIDEEVADDVTEVWNEETYNEYLKRKDGQ
ncbi:hypothetical protein AB3N02_22215 [Priestia aryabhattai]|uniref:hypothetical protein n=1 Tax=Priestia aryabhattai TaxID=412384 RepID=UPI0039A206D7